MRGTCCFGDRGYHNHFYTAKRQQLHNSDKSSLWRYARVCHGHLVRTSQRFHNDSDVSVTVQPPSSVNQWWSWLYSHWNVWIIVKPLASACQMTMTHLPSHASLLKQESVLLHVCRSPRRSNIWTVQLFCLILCESNLSLAVYFGSLARMQVSAARLNLFNNAFL